MRFIRSAWPMVREAFSDWSEDNAPRLGAALAYYTVFSLAPLLIIVIAIAGLVFGEEAARGQIVDQVRGLVGDDAGKAIQDMIARAQQPTSGLLATACSLVALVFGASGVFGELQAALDTVWEVAPKPGRGLRGIIKDRFLSLTMVLGTGFLLLVSLVASAALAAAGGAMRELTPGLEAAAHVVETLVSFGVTTLLFAAMFKFLPDARVQWRDVWVGAIVTAALFTVGKFAIGLYLGHAGVTSAYGAAGSLVVILVWVYYSAQILLFGAELTQVYATRTGSQVEPAPDAIKIERPSRPAPERRPA